MGLFENAVNTAKSAAKNVGKRQRRFWISLGTS